MSTTAERAYGRAYRLRWRRERGIFPRVVVDDESRFWPKVDASGDCWEWTAAKTPDGYGLFSTHRPLANRRSRTITSHRWLFEHLVGPIPAGLTLDHLCRNRVCCNPDHLEPVTSVENERRGYWGLRSACKNGHLWVAANLGSSGNRRGRVCRACVREGQSRYQARLRAAGA